MRTIHDQAIEAALNAAKSTCDHMLFSKSADFHNDSGDLCRFILDNPTAPPEAAFITAKRLGLDDGSAWSEITATERMGYQIFISVFLTVSDALDAAEAEARALDEAEVARLEAAGQRRIGGIPDDELEGTPFEKVADPLALSEIGKVAAERKRLDEERQAHEARVREFEERQVAAEATGKTHEVVVEPRVGHAEMAPPVEPQPEVAADAPEAEPAKASEKPGKKRRR